MTEKQELIKWLKTKSYYYEIRGNVVMLSRLNSWIAMLEAELVRVDSSGKIIEDYPVW